jgi:fructose/tagatose bisphosphate aldolase
MARTSRTKNCTPLPHPAVRCANLASYDPRVWVREGEKTMSKRVAEALKEFNAAGQL